MIRTMALKEITSAKCFEGYQKVFEHDSISTRCPMKFGVYLPPCYGPDKPCPVVFFLQGLTCTEQNFIIKSGAQRYASQLGLILVNPDTSPRGCNIPGEDDDFDFGTGAGFYVNATQEPFNKNYHMYDYVTKELPELIEKNFNIINGKYGLFGHSMGGHGALMVGLRNPDRFISVSAFSAMVNPSTVPWGIKAFTGYLGADNDWSMYDTVELIKKHGKRFASPPLIDQGDEDEWLHKNLKPELLAQVCAEVGQEIILRYQKGYDHYYCFISTFMEDHLKFHAKNLAKF
ncbi:unnamed protein product [Hymenolepis diminuta]|uniref:S-formylglutathione hydrolase n=1 Tax=Hymenolepis diminuta TaxID=6216 RepID=A0A564Z7F5_HYMDI|nr:unnamed protein product [Hymenolepis diminuta]